MPGLIAPSSRPWVGVNYWSAAGGPRMWRRYEPSVVREELRRLVEHGLGVVRSFLFWPDFVPEEGGLDEAVLDRFVDFLDACAESGLGTIPTLLVGHMSGENWDPPWRGGRDLYRDVTLVAEQARYVAEVACRVREHPAVVGWLLSNEMPLYGGAASTEEVTSWARLLLQALRSAGVTQPVSVGDGAWGIEVTGRDNGFSLRALAPLVDFLGPHVYPAENDPVRQALAAAFACELAGGFGKPVVLEEFGVSSDFASGEHAGAYYRQVLHTTLLAGCGGWIAWNNCDYDALFGEDPYRHHPFEMHFGLFDAGGEPKPQLEELERFARRVERLAHDGVGRVRADVALVVPEHFERALPFVPEQLRLDIGVGLFQSYVAAREADLPVELVRERDGLDLQARLLLLPGAKLLSAPSWAALASIAESGATVYVSYFAGSTQDQHGPWIPWVERLFGVRHLLRYGPVDPIEGDVVRFVFVEGLGDLSPGDSLCFAVAGNESARAYLPVEPVGARVLATDDGGHPALVRHDLGAGSVVLCTYPIEHMAAWTARVNPEPTWRLYSALAEAAGVERPVRADDPRVLLGRLRTGRDEVLVLVSTAGEALEVPLVVGEGSTVQDLDAASDAPPIGAVRLEPMGALLLRHRRGGRR